MRLVAVTNTQNERGRYLERTGPALLKFVDEWVVQDDASTDGTPDYLTSIGAHVFEAVDGARWREDEGALHNRLLEHALSFEPTHVIAVDADEVVLDGAGVRTALEVDEEMLTREGRPRVYTLTMLELWQMDPPLVRHDGGWRPHEVGICYSVPPAGIGAIRSKKLASPRIPHDAVLEIRRRRGRATGVAIVHLGWANPLERAERHRRYAELDGGRYHTRRHLASILYPDAECDLRPLDPLHVAQLERALK